MQDTDLTVAAIVEHGLAIHAQSRVITADSRNVRVSTFAEMGARARNLAGALRELGVGLGDRVATCLVNHHEHLEAYLAVPSMGAVLHTLNMRLSTDQLRYIMMEAEDRVVIIDAAFAPTLAPIVREVPSIEHLLVVGRDTDCVESTIARGYSDVLESSAPMSSFPDLDERSPAIMCHTSGTTGNPKGVVYSHRSIWLHSMAICSGNVYALCERDVVLVVVPMFHANGWGLPHAAWFMGADLLLPNASVGPEALAMLASTWRPTVSAGVPTVWNDLLLYGEKCEIDLSSLRLVAVGGAAVPRSLIEAFERRYGVRIHQGWGMTETSPLCALASSPKYGTADNAIDYRAKTGRVVAGVQIRVVNEDGAELPKDGQTVGELEVRGPWVTGSYYKGRSPESFNGDWLRTGDLGTLDEAGFIQITDRIKDVIKSGGEWISSVHLENVIATHPDVLEAAVIAIPDVKWDERPLACVVLRDCDDPAIHDLTIQDLCGFLSSRVQKWTIPERWACLRELPRTSVGKVDKKQLRAHYDRNALLVREVSGRLR